MQAGRVEEQLQLKELRKDLEHRFSNAKGASSTSNVGKKD
jgi:hypothetical protein